MTRSRLNVGILGCGDAGSEHARAYRQLGNRARVVAVGDVNFERARSFAREETDGAEAFSSLKAMLVGAEFDALSVCVPNNAHHASTMAALDAGKHVLCEKPPAMTPEQAAEMASAKARAGKVLTYGMVYRQLGVRFMPFLTEIGPVYDVLAWWMRRRGIPGWGIYGSLALQGGGTMTDMGVHLVDAAWAMMGRPVPRLVSARFWRHKALTSKVGLLGPWDAARFEVEDYASAVVDFDEARLLVLPAFASDILPAEVARVEWQGIGGRLIWPWMTTQEQAGADDVPLVVGERHGFLTTTRIELPQQASVWQGYRDEIAHFVACCLGEAEPLVTAEDGVTVQRMLSAMTKSAARGGEQIKL